MTVIDGSVPWPEATATRYRAEGYWQGSSLASRIAGTVDRTPGRIAVIDGSTRVTYRELWERAGMIAATLLDLGLVPGDRLVVALPNCWEFVALTVGCLRTGLVPVMALPAHRRHELTHIAETAGAAALVIAGDDRGTDLRTVAQQVGRTVAGIRAVLVHGDLTPGAAPTGVPEYPLVPNGHPSRPLGAVTGPGGSDIACMLLSGGTTGLPKLIARTHDDYLCNIVHCAEVAEFDSDTVYLGALPASHNFSLACPGILGALIAGGRVVMLPSPAPERALRAVAAEGVTVAAVVPAVAQSWIEYRRAHPEVDTSTLRVLQVGGTRMPDELAARVEPVLGARLQQVFGMAEGLINMTRLDDDPAVIVGTQGRPVCPADEILIVDESGTPVPDGTPGSLLTRGPYTPRGYFRAPEHNTRAFTPDGWYGSGDIVIRRPDGNLVVAGRDKDMINRGGEKISAEEVENFAYRVPGVEVAAAVAMPDPVLGERTCLYVTVRAGFVVGLDDVVTVMNRAGVARFKLPEKLILLDTMPTTKVGKVDKKALRDDIRTRL